MTIHAQPSSRVTTPGLASPFPSAMARVVGSFATAVALVVIVGWTLGIGELTGRFWLLEGRMMPNTAFSFASLGIAWLLAATGRAQSVRAARFLAAVGGTIGALTLFEYGSGWNLGIDELILAESSLFPGVEFSGRMAPEMAVCLVFLATAFQFAIADQKRLGHTLVSAGCGLFVVAIGAETLIALAAPEWIGSWMIVDVQMSGVSAILVSSLGALSLVLEWRTRANAWAIDRLNTLAIAMGSVLLLVAGMNAASLFGEILVTNQANEVLHQQKGDILGLRHDMLVGPDSLNEFVHTRQPESRTAVDAASARARGHLDRIRLWATDDHELQAIAGGVLADANQSLDRTQSILRLVDAGADRGEFSGFFREGNALEERLFARLDAASDRLRAAISSGTGLADQRAGRSRAVLGFGTVASLLILLFAVLRLNRAELGRRRSDDGRARAQAVASIGHWRVDLIGDNSEWSAETYRIYGIPESAELTHELFLKRLHPDDRNWVEAEWAAALKGGDYDVEYRIIVDGAVRWVHELGEVERGPSGVPVAGVGIVREITEERNAARTLKRLATIIHETPEMVIVCDPQLSVTFINRSATRALGIDIESDPGALDLASCFSDRDFAHLTGAAIPLAAREGTWSGRSVLRVAGREEIPIFLVLIAHRAGGGIVEQYSLVIRDLSAETQVEEADKALREEQRAKANLLSNLPGMAYRCRNDADWTMEFVSDGCLALTGYEADQLLGNSLVSYAHLIHREDQGPVWDQVQEALKARRPYELLYRIRTREGAEKWVLEHGSGVFGDDGKLVALEGFIGDTTARKLAEQRVATSEKKFSVLFQSSPVSMTITRLSDQRLVEANAGFERLSGHRASDVIGKTVFEIDLVKDRAKRERFVEQLRATGRVAPTESFIFTTAGERRETLFTAELVTIDGEDHAIVSTIDITDRKRAEQQVRLQATAIDAAANAIAITDKEARIVFVNPAFCAMTGYAAEWAIGKKMSILNSGRHDRAFFADMWRTILAGDVWRGEITNRRSDGTPFLVEQTITPVEGDDGGIAYFIAISQDVTAARRHEEEALRSERLSSVGRLAGGIAHDLNNILAPMMMVPSLIRPGIDDPEALRLLDFVENNAKRGAAIIKQLLTFSRGTAGPRRSVQVGELVAEMAGIVRETFPKNINSRVAGADVRADVIVDPTQIHQVLMNLCVNARDAMPRGGDLTLAVELIAVDVELARSHSGAKVGPHVVISVSDTGTGIPADVLDKIFDPFFTTKAIGEGTGLGLSTALGIVRSHGGFLRVETEEGKGTRFSISLPVATAEAVATQVAPVTPADRGRGETLLLVDDEDGARRTLRTLLERRGYVVIEARNGAEGLEQFRKQPDAIHAVISDHSMPVMGGKEFIAELRAARPDIPVILCSGNLGESSPGDSPGTGPNYVLEKPFMPAELLQLLRKAITGNAG